MEVRRVLVKLCHEIWLLNSFRDNLFVASTFKKIVEYVAETVISRANY